MAVRRLPPDPSLPLKGYEVRWRDPNGGEHRKRFKGKQRRAAEAFFAQTRAAMANGQYIDQGSKTTVAEYARQWVAIQPYRPSSRERRESQIRTHLEPSRLGRMRLVAVRRSDIQEFATAKDQERAPATVRNLMALVAAIFNAAARDRLIAFSPASRIALSAPDHEPVIPLTVDQVRALVEVMPARMQAMVIFQVSTGLRIGELLALRPSEIDFLRREVMIMEQLHPRTRERQRLKTPASRRVVPLPQTAVDALAAHLVQFPANDEGYVFTNELGLPFQAHTYQQMLSYRAKRAGLPHATSHDLRHTYASWLLLAGESIATVAARLGHRNVAITLATYAHCMPTTEDRTRRAIDGLCPKVARMG